jgi:hypothetical protein
MTDPQLKFINEPFLTFANNQKAIDPRDGLMLFGAFDHKKVNGQKIIGIIGTAPLRQLLIEYLKKIHSPVLNSERTIARPNFPGIEAVLGISINFDNIPQLNIDQKDIDEYLRYSDSHQRVHNWVNLYVKKLNNYVNTEEIHVDVWLVIIPQCIFKYGRPKSRIEHNENNISKGLKPHERNSNLLFLFPDMQEENDKLNEAYQFEVNFHNQLKAKVLSSKIITQIIREETINYQNMYADNEERIKTIRQFDTAKAWNISTTLYYKLGGLPWKLGAVRENVCYLGLVYKKIGTISKRDNACCAAQMFLDSGDGMVFRGNIGPWWNEKTKEFHLPRQDAFQLISQSMTAFFGRFNFYPTEIFIHAKTYFDDNEWAGFEEATIGKSKIVGVRIRGCNNFKIYRQNQYCVPRGTMLQYDDNKAYLWTKGFIPRFQTQIGLETPNPLEIEITKGNASIDTVCKDILGLTKLNYNACVYGDGEPVTLKFAESVGEILTAGKNIKADVLTFKYYI